MKKLLVIVTIILASYSFSNAQELGIRLGNVYGGNVAIDAIFATGEFNRVHADASFGGDGFAVDLIWDFLYRPLGGEPFNWYVGVGPYIVLGDPFWLGAVGEIGLEYHFNTAPIVIGADWRPAISIVKETDLHFNGFGLNIRYRFGE